MPALRKGNGVIGMGKELCLRLLRRVCAAVLALLAAILISTPVMAEDGMPQVSPEPALTEQDFAAVALMRPWRNSSDR